MFKPKAHIAESSEVGSIDAYEDLYQRALHDPDGYWLEEAMRLDWLSPPRRVKGADFNEVDLRWFEGGTLNACYNCVDRHARERPEDTAIIWAADEPGEYRHISFSELQREVCRAAGALRSAGVRKGDRVCLYLPMIPELAFIVLACARIGAIHSVVFAGFSAQALRDRVLDARSKVVVTADEGLRGGRTIQLKQTVDAAVEGLSVVETVFVARRTGAKVSMTPGRDLWLDEAMAKQRPYMPPVAMDAEDPLFILYTSGSTGRPKGLMHTTGGYLTYAATTHRLVFDLKPDDIYFCAADVGWITGHSYILYGPLANGTTSVMFESTPVYPDASRYWQVVEDLGVTIFYTAPTAIRAIARDGDEPVKKHDRSSLRILGTVGEPINPEIWLWYHHVVGEDRCAIVDTWWQTETGGILISPLPGATPTKPGSATLPLPGIVPVLVDDEGQELDHLESQGNLCIANPWPGQARTIWGDHERFVRTYFSRFPGRYFTGDGCRRDADGFHWITGRVDDVINVAGHRLGTAEVESALVAHDAVAEAAVIGVPHEIKGTGIVAFCILLPDWEDVDPMELSGVLKGQVRSVIGPIATPDRIVAVPGLPKTRSGKIMRRILRAVATHEHDDMGDISTLADSTVVEALIDAWG